MRKKRRSRGATMGMVAVAALIFVLIGVFVIFLVKLLGGGEQMQRATDSGNLTLTRAELDQFTYPLPSSGVQHQFNGASDHTSGGDGVINLRNINAVMGQSFLVTFNAYVMQQQGVNNGATANAQATQTAANQIAASLASSMANASDAFNQFSNTAKKMPTHEFGTANNTSGGAPEFSYLDRGQPSSVYVDPHQLADYDFTANSSALYNNKIAPLTGTVSSASDAGSNKYLLGYIDGIKPDNTYQSTYFVPLRPGARPHLVSRPLFTANQVATSGAGAFNWATPVANAVSQKTIKQDSEAAFAQFAAYGQMQPIDPKGIPLSIKHGFIRIINGGPSPASGYAAAGGNNQDVFVYTMNDPQFYAVDSTGHALPYFIGQNDPSFAAVSQALATGGTLSNCSGFSVGYALNGNTIGAGGVTTPNCQQITGLSPNVINNHTLSTPGSAPNSDMHQYNSSDLLGYYARPLLEAAYNLQPAQATGSNGVSVNVGDSVNLALLTARAQGNNFTLNAGAYTSGIAYIPPNRGSLSSPNFMIAQQPEGAYLNSSAGGGQEGIQKYGKIWNILAQRFYEIDPSWPTYCQDPADPQHRPNVDTILSQAMVPLGKNGIIYYSASGNGGRGGLVLKEEQAAIADAPWLSAFVNQTPDGRTPTSPTEVKTFPLVAEGGTGGDAPSGMIDVDGDWGYPHPYDDPPSIAILNWFTYTQSSGYNNLLGELKLGATNTNGATNACPTNGAAYTINSGAGPGGVDTITLPTTGACGNPTTGGGPC